MKRFFALAVTGLLLLGTSAWAAVEIVDSVTNTAQNDLGFGRAPGHAGSGSVAVSYLSSASAVKPFDDQSYTIQLDYNCPVGEYIWFVEPLTSGTNVDLSAYKYLSFWVRGAAGGEGFQVGLNDGSHASRVQVAQMLPNGITTQWQKVVVPFSVLVSSATANPDVVLTSVNKIEFIIANSGIDDYGRLVGSVSGTVYIDNIAFGSSAPAPVWVSNYDHTVLPSGNTLNAARGIIARYCTSGTNGTYTSTTFTSAPYSLIYGNPGDSGTNYTVHNLFRTTSGASQYNCTDISGCNKVQFDLRGANGNEAPSILVQDRFYIGNTISFGTIGTDFHTAQIALSAFNPGTLDFTQTMAVNFVDTDLFNTTGGSVYVDNLVFIDDSPVSTAPSSMTFNGSAVTTGYTISGGASGTLGATALSIGADPKMEFVRFEYSNDSGSTWHEIADDYATASGKTSYAVQWFYSSLPNGTYQLKATSYHVGGAALALTPISVTLSSGTPSTPTFTPTISPTPSISPTASPSLTISPTPSISATSTPTATPTPTVVVLPTNTATPTSTATPYVQELGVGRNSFNPAVGQVLPLEARMTSQGKVHIVIYSRLGDKIIDLFNQDAGPGLLELSWDGKNSDGHNVASGVYVIYAELGDQKSKHLVAVIH